MPTAERLWYDNLVSGKGDGSVPCSIGIDIQGWVSEFRQHTEFLKELAQACPHVTFHMPSGSGRDGSVEVADKWGCKWLYNEVSNDGQCIGHPLENLEALEAFTVPDISTYLDWDTMAKGLANQLKEGSPGRLYFEHGFFYLRMTYLRGYENFLVDTAERSEQALHLLAAVTDFWENVGKKTACLGADVIVLGDDLGMQHSLPMSPKAWREVIKPAYARVVSAFKSHGTAIYLHTDGMVVDIISDLIECGVDILNVQDVVNGLDNLARWKGQVSYDLDIDRQNVTVFGTPSEIRSHIRECVSRLGSPAGRLALTYGCYKGVPLQNLEAVFLGMEECHDMWKYRDGSGKSALAPLTGCNS